MSKNSNHSSEGASEEQYTYFGAERVEIQSKTQRVGEVFTSVAERYDLMNDLLSGGLHRRWKGDLVAWMAPGSERRSYLHVDLAGGTGDVAYRVQNVAGAAARSIVVDINEAMVRRGVRRLETEQLAEKVSFVVGDAEHIPLPDHSVDAVTIAFGIRNVTRIENALADIFRVLRFGGRFICLEFSHVSVPVLDHIYDAYSDRIIPLIGQTVTGNGQAYSYLVESIRNFPDQKTFAAMISAEGFDRVAWRDLSGGIAALHSGWRL